MAAALDHPNIIPVFDAGEAGGVLYIAMRYVECPEEAGRSCSDSSVAGCPGRCRFRTSDQYEIREKKS